MIQFDLRIFFEKGLVQPPTSKKMLLKEGIVGISEADYEFRFQEISS